MRLCQFFAASLDIKSFELHQKCFEIKPGFFHIVNVYFSEKAHDRAIWSQSYGWTDAKRHHAVLRFCSRASKGPLPQHSILQTSSKYFTILYYLDLVFKCVFFGEGTTFWARLCCIIKAKGLINLRQDQNFQFNPRICFLSNTGFMAGKHYFWQ